MFKLLIVEDNELFRMVLKDLLTDRFPFVVIQEAVDGKTAMEKTAAFNPDLVLMDIGLPDESGLRLTEKIKAQYPHIWIVILTAYDLPEYRELAYRLGANGFLSKGSTSNRELVSVVKSFLPQFRNAEL